MSFGVDIDSFLLQPDNNSSKLRVFFFKLIVSYNVMMFYNSTSTPPISSLSRIISPCNWSILTLHHDDYIEHPVSHDTKKKTLRHINKQAKIGIVLVYDKRTFNETIAMMSIENKREYCEAHNLNLVVFDEPIHQDRPVAWSKFPALLEQFQNFDYLVFFCELQMAGESYFY